MNCQDFESNVDNLARGALMDARAREIALAHESACAACAARLVDERALTSGLRVLAAAAKEREAPARVEAGLLTAFRARAASSVAVAETINASEGAHRVTFAPGSSVAPLADETTSRPWSWVRTVVVASLAAAAALALFMLIPPDVLKMKAVVTDNQTAERKTDATSTAKVETSIQNNEQISAPVNVAVTPPRPTVEENSPGAAVQRRSNRAAQSMSVSFDAARARGSQSRYGIDQTASNEEVTTDFIPLMQGERLQGEGGHLVRVELPRSALERFGLPVNADRGSGRVKADVLLGEDGLARAIRFVR